MTMHQSITPEHMTDAQLLSTCEYFGRLALQSRNKFIGLLPEVARRKLYQKRGCMGIIEYAKKFGGLSEEQTRLALNLRERFNDKPELKTLLENGTVSINKLSRVASIATSENEKELAEKVQMLPQHTIETMVRDYKIETAQASYSFKSLRAQTSVQQTEILKSTLRDDLHLATDITIRLLELQRKGIDINELLRVALDTREQQIQAKKDTLSETCEQTNSRYIPAEIRKIIQEEYGTKCSIKHCSQPSGEIHHEQRFSVSHTHDPNHLTPMCKDHHKLVHAADVKLFEIRNNKLR